MVVPVPRHRSRVTPRWTGGFTLPEEVALHRFRPDIAVGEPFDGGNVGGLCRPNQEANNSHNRYRHVDASI